MDIVTLALAKKFAAKVASGFSHVEVDGLNIIFTLNDGSQVTLTVPEPVSDISITDMNIDNDGNLICTMSNGKNLNAGRIKFNPKGIYDNSTQYSLFDLINYNGSSYVAKDNTIGNLPTNSQYWQLIAEKGETGEVSQTQFDDLQEQVKDKENNELKGTQNGTNLDIFDSADSRVKEMKAPQGNSTQETTEGNQLIDFSQFQGVGATYTFANDILVIDNSSGNTYARVRKDITQLIKENAGKKINSGYDNKSQTGNGVYSSQLIIGTTSGTSYHAFASKGAYTIPDDVSNITDVSFNIYQNNSGSSNGGTLTIVKPILYFGTEKPDYEKFTYGASPNLNYEQPIKSAGDNGFINEKIVNGNLFDKNASVNGEINGSDGSVSPSNTYKTSDFIPVVAGQDYYLSGKNDGQSNCFYDENKNFVQTLTKTKGIITVPNNENIKYIRFNFNGSYNNTVMFLKSSTEVAYIEHKEQTFSIPTQQPMRSIGTTRDCFFKNTVESEFYDSTLEENKWYERHPIFRKIFTGNEIVTKGGTSNNNQFIIAGLITDADLSFLGNYNDNVVSQILSNNFISIGTTSNNNGRVGITLCKYSPNTQIRFGLGINSTITTVANFKAWLAQKYSNDNPVYLDYILAEPIDILCTEAQTEALEAYMKARTYKNVTHIYTEDEVPAYIELEYIKDLEQVIDNTLPASKIITLTQDEYDAIQTKDDDTYYFITESIENNNMGEE